MEVHASLKAEEIAFLGPIPITNSMLMAWLAILVLAVFAFFAGRNPQLVPGGAQNVMEAILEALLSLVENTAGHYARRVFPLIATLFLFILTANYMNLLPGVGTIWVVNPNAAPRAGDPRRCRPCPPWWASPRPAPRRAGPPGGRSPAGRHLPRAPKEHHVAGDGALAAGGQRRPEHDPGHGADRLPVHPRLRRLRARAGGLHPGRPGQAGAADADQAGDRALRPDLPLDAPVRQHLRRGDAPDGDEPPLRRPSRS